MEDPSVSWFIAAGVLLGGLLLLLALRRRAEPDISASARAAVSTGSTPVVPDGEPDPAATEAAAEAVGAR